MLSAKLVPVSLASRHSKTAMLLVQELILLLIDEMGHRNIAEYRIPWSWLYPFYQYHIEMLLVSSSPSHSCRIVRFKSFHSFALDFHLQNTSQYLQPVTNPAPEGDDSRDLRLFISITRKQDLLSRNELRYYGLEVLLNHFDLNIPQKDSLYAVARVVPSYTNYK